MRLSSIVALVLPVNSLETRTQRSNSSFSQLFDNNVASPLPAENILCRNAEIASRLAAKPVHGVRKMSDDEGEKFFLDYWRFSNDTPGNLLERKVDEDMNTTTTAIDASPGTIECISPDHANMADEDSPAAIFLARSYPFQPPALVDSGTGPQRRSFTGILPNLLESRDFKCPTGTHECKAINRPSRCCGSGESCELIKDIGSGDVGCCPNWQTCSGQIGSCQRGYTACSQALGGGCCIPGYECVPGGCKSCFTVCSVFISRNTTDLNHTGAYISVVTITAHSTVIVSTKTYSTSPQTSPSSPSSPSSIGTEITENLVPPARPTSPSTTTSNDDACPTGFYACSAVYHGGCCRTGRDCDTTSCPTTSSTTFTSNGETIAVPVLTTGHSAETGRCAKGWFSCADTVGGGCCPMGFACGSSCVATATETTTVAKEKPTHNSGEKLRSSGLVLGLGLLGMWWL
ncbi:hypothetical protein NUU61_007709 [Penicillium alfredii]|uniref:GPI anchored protein n=1 Tax=Penicillium alfredii TaxID=1506179 RepID=A0A9W9JZ94_9EURO|nr:uncharacterized protein NUU61_007709 [Penicillium alfredii]KAJ5086402.1 hypothetical protein NUU61_007709 [Penicillium alfredii]